MHKTEHDGCVASGHRGRTCSRSSWRQCWCDTGSNVEVGFDHLPVRQRYGSRVLPCPCDGDIEVRPSAQDCRESLTEQREPGNSTDLRRLQGVPTGSDGAVQNYLCRSRACRGNKNKLIRDFVRDTALLQPSGSRVHEQNRSILRVITVQPLQWRVCKVEYSGQRVLYMSCSREAEA